MLTTKEYNDAIVELVEETVSYHLPDGFISNIGLYKVLGASYISIFIHPDTNGVTVSQVSNQYPWAVSLSLDPDTMELETQVFGGMGGNSILLHPNDRTPRPYMYDAVKVPFRKPGKSQTSVMKALAKFIMRYIETLQANKDRLLHVDMVTDEVRAAIGL
jgi:hypothetical protein